MSDKLLVSTRKGLFTVSRRSRRWEIEAVDFLGDNVTITLTDPRNGRHYAALDHGLLASNSIVRRRTAGKRSQLPSIRPSRTAMRRPICGAGRSTGPQRASGHSLLAV
jgi:hypothetical protein